MTQNVNKVIVTDGGPLALATALISLAYGLDYTDTSVASLKAHLGLGDVQAHTIETAFSYPNGVGLIAENGRTSLYIFDSEQEELKVGAEVRRLGLAEGQTPADVLPAGGAATAALPTAAVGSAAAASIAPAPEPAPPPAPPPAPQPVDLLPAGHPLADSGDLPPAGDGGNVLGTSDVSGVPADPAAIAAVVDTAGGEGAGDQVAPGAGALPPEAAGDLTSAESEAAAAGREPSEGLIDPNAEELKPVPAESNAYVEGRAAYGTAQNCPYPGDSEQATDWFLGHEDAEKADKASKGQGDQSGFHSAEG